MSDHLAELKEASKASPARSDRELLRTGESVWFMGRPVESRDGIITIAQTEEMHLLIAEADIVEVRKKDEYFLLRVRGEANVVARFQQVMRADSRGCECDGHDEMQAAALQQQGPWGDPIGPPFLDCRIWVQCRYILGLRICWWWVFCPSRTGRI